MTNAALYLINLIDIHLKNILIVITAKIIPSKIPPKIPSKSEKIPSFLPKPILEGISFPFPSKILESGNPDP